MIANAINLRLRAFAGLTALVGGATPRIYPYIMPQSPTYPAVTHQQISGRRESAMGADTGIVEGRWQVDIWSAAGVVEMNNVAAQVRLALKRWRGTYDTTEVLDVYLEEEDGGYDPDVQKYFVTQDYRVFWRE